MVAFLFSLLSTKLGRIGLGALGVLILFGGAYIKGNLDGRERVQTKFDAYKVQVAQDAAAEKARQAKIAADMIQQIQIQLTVAEADAATARAAASEYAAKLAAKPPIPGRGATQDDVNALNR